MRVIGFTRNFGHQAALCAGLDHATGDAVVLIDADLQDPPELIADFVREVARGIRGRLRPAATSRGGLPQARRLPFLLQAAPRPRQRRHAARHRRLLPHGSARRRRPSKPARAHAVPAGPAQLGRSCARSAIEYTRHARHQRRVEVLGRRSSSSWPSTASSPSRRRRSSWPSSWACSCRSAASSLIALLVYLRADAQLRPPRMDVPDGHRPVPRRHPAHHHRDRGGVHRPHLRGGQGAARSIWSAPQGRLSRGRRGRASVGGHRHRLAAVKVEEGADLARRDGGATRRRRGA